MRGRNDDIRASGYTLEAGEAVAVPCHGAKIVILCELAVIIAHMQLGGLRSAVDLGHDLGEAEVQIHVLTHTVLIHGDMQFGLAHRVLGILDRHLDGAFSSGKNACLGLTLITSRQERRAPLQSRVRGLLGLRLARGF